MLFHACRSEWIGMTKLYNDYIELDDFNMSVKSGIMLGFIGPNGAGQTSTICARVKNGGLSDEETLY